MTNLKNLSCWKKKEYLTVHMAASLILDIDPYSFDPTQPIKPDSYMAVFSLIIDDIKSHLYRDKVEAYADDLEYVFNIHTVRPELGGTNLIYGFKAEEVMIKQSAIALWCNENNIDSEYFNTKKALTNNAPKPPKPWLIHNDQDPKPAYEWYTAARYFARQLVEENPYLSTRRDLLAPKIVKKLDSVGKKKRGGKKSFTDSTIKKALNNVNFG